MMTANTRRVDLQWDHAAIIVRDVRAARYESRGVLAVCGERSYI
jgi:hypothetical protein